MSQAIAENKIISLIDPAILAIPIKECHEPMIDLKEQNLIVYGSSPEIPNNTDYTKIRKSVYMKLVEAQSTLPPGLRFCLYEDYRSLQLQDRLFKDRFIKIKKQYPAWNDEKVFLETAKLVSPTKNLDGSHNTPPHSTGGAIDIYLIDNQSKIVDMGIEVAHWMNVSP
jgi:zinc D-Ala-D-Ala dipeptidase